MMHLSKHVGGLNFMSKCSNTDTRFFKTPNAGICDICHPCETTTKLEATAMCPPIGEPKCILR